MKRIAVCIDDYGLHPAVDDAILALVDTGRVTAASCMVGAPAWQYDAARLKERFDAGRVEAGLHLDLTEYPMDARHARKVGAWIRHSHFGGVDRDGVRMEIGAQLDAFEAAMGRAPAYVDGHQHVHQLPVIRKLLVEELERRYAKAGLPWLRSTRGAGRWRLKGRVIEATGAAALADLARKRGFALNTSLLGVYDFRGGPQRYRGLLAQWLHDARDGDLLMCHVATGIVPGDEIAQARVDEYGVLAGEGFEEMAGAAGISVARMSEILQQPAATMAGFRRGG